MALVVPLPACGGQARPPEPRRRSSALEAQSLSRAPGAGAGELPVCKGRRLEGPAASDRYEGEVHVYPDLATNLDLEDLKGPGPQTDAGTEKSLLVGINPFPYHAGFYWPGESDRSEYEKYVKKIAEFSFWLVNRRHGSPGDAVASAPAGPSRHLQHRDDQDLLRLLRRLDYVIASRFHGILLSFMLGKPVVAVSYHQKEDSLMRDMGQADYLLDMRDFDVRGLSEAFEWLVADGACITKIVGAKIEENRRALQEQYRTVLGT